jgi:16S rRNA (guanine527-N7)-methyltransferase
MTDLAPLLNAALTANHQTLSAEAQDQLIRYLHCLLRWNNVFNLTAITDERKMIDLHLIDSLAVAPYLQGKRFLDVGSGGGLPGIPLAIAHPAQRWVLVDKSSKKTHFLMQVKAELDLKHVEVHHARVETLTDTIGFDTVVSRAFGTLRQFIETTAHLLAPQGILLAMKGQYPQDELADLPPHFVVKRVERLPVVGLQQDRHIVILARGIDPSHE